MRKTVAFIFLVSLSMAAYGQDQTLLPQGMFLEDSVAVGEHVLYSMKYTYPKEWDLIFPDSSYNFFPFEYVSKTYYPTEIDSTHLTDSVVYTLTTFELDSILYFSVPVFVLGEERDSIRYFSNIDSIYFKPALDSLPAEPKLRSNTEYVKVSKKFNYIYFLIGAGVFLILASGFAVAFGRKLVNWLKVKRLQRAHNRFSKRYRQLLSNRNLAEKKYAEGVLKLWKDYMEKLEKRPFTKLTTKEIALIYSDEELRKSLREIDRVLYGGFESSQATGFFERLVEFSNSRLRFKIEELRHG